MMMASLLCLKCNLLIALLLNAISIESAFIHHQNQYQNQQQQQQHRLNRINRTPSIQQHNSLERIVGSPILAIKNNKILLDNNRMITNKFILLTNGDQIKLYPSVPATTTPKDLPKVDDNQELDFKPTNYHYVIEPMKFNLSSKGDNDDEKRSTNIILDQLGDNKLSRWLTEEAIKSASPRKMSILPDQEEFVAYNEAWKKPWITEVDYFFDERFCNRTTTPNDDDYSFVEEEEEEEGVEHGDNSRHVASIHQTCLVIVWLDKSNNFVRYGSLDLIKNPIYAATSITSKGKNRVLFINEFPPIDIETDFGLNSKKARVHGMLIDKTMLRLYIVVQDDDDLLYPNKILNGKFLPQRKGGQVIDSMIMRRTTNNRREKANFRIFNDIKMNFSNCDREYLERRHPISQRSFKFLNYLDGIFYYFDKDKGGKIFAFGLSEWESQQQMGSQVFVIDTSLISNLGFIRHKYFPTTDDATDDDMSKQHQKAATTGITLDKLNRRIYWLDEANHLFSCNLEGQDVKPVGRLVSKSTAREPYSMQVYQETIFISDPNKKSIVAFKLPNSSVSSSSPPENVDNNSSSSSSNHDKTIIIKPIIEHHQENKPTTTIKSQVLVVEMPTLYGFKIMQLSLAEEEEGDSEVGIGDDDEEAEFLNNSWAKFELNMKQFNGVDECAFLQAEYRYGIDDFARGASELVVIGAIVVLLGSACFISIGSCYLLIYLIRKSFFKKEVDSGSGTDGDSLDSKSTKQQQKALQAIIIDKNQLKFSNY